jgi:hypothetical protein
MVSVSLIGGYFTSLKWLTHDRLLGWQRLFCGNCMHNYHQTTVRHKTLHGVLPGGSIRFRIHSVLLLHVPCSSVHRTELVFGSAFLRRYLYATESRHLAWPRQQRNDPGIQHWRWWGKESEEGYGEVPWRLRHHGAHRPLRAGNWRRLWRRGIGEDHGGEILSLFSFK